MGRGWEREMMRDEVRLGDSELRSKGGERGKEILVWGMEEIVGWENMRGVMEGFYGKGGNGGGGYGVERMVGIEWMEDW